MDQYLSLDVFLAAVLVDNPDVEAEAFVCFYGLNSDSNAADPCSATVPAGDTPTAAGDVFGVYSSAVEDANENVNADTAVTVVPVAAAPTTAPGKPTLTATPGIGGRTVDLVWTVPDDDGGAPISGYQFRWRLARHMFTSDEDAWATIRGSNAGTTTHTVTGLTAGVVHVFQVRARNSVGAGAASDEQSATPTAADSVNPVVHIRSGAASGVDVSVSRPPIAGEHRLILIVTDDRALSDDLSALAQIVLTDFELSLERPPVPPARAEPLYLSLDVFSAAVVVDNPAVEAEAFVCFYGRNADASAADPCSETVPAGNIPTAAGDVFSVFGGAAKDAANRDSGDAEVTVAPDPDAPPSNTAPVITTSAALSVAEGGSGVSVATFAADDADNDVLVWTTTGGADTAQLGVSPSGLLSFADIPDFENPRDTGSDNVYEITVTVTDDGTPPASATLDVSVTVSNVEEAGTVTIAPSTAPRVGDTLTASVADPDGSITGTTWQWASSTNATDYAPVSGATAAAYTPAPGDAGKTLRATAAYTDGHGGGKTATSDPTPTVLPATPLPPDTTSPVLLIRSGTVSAAALPAFSGPDLAANAPMAGEHRLILILTDDRALPAALYASNQILPVGILIHRGADFLVFGAAFPSAAVIPNPDLPVEAFLCLYGPGSGSDPCAPAPADAAKLMAGDRVTVGNAAAKDASERFTAETEVTVVAADPSALASVPGAPRNLRAVPAANGNVALLWEAPAYLGPDGAVVVYQVRSTAEGTPFSDDEAGWAEIAPNPVQVVEAETRYVFQMRATNAKGAGAPAEVRATSPTETDDVSPVILIRSATVAGAALPVFGQPDIAANAPMADEHRLLFVVADDRYMQPSRPYNQLTRLDAGFLGYLPPGADPNSELYFAVDDPFTEAVMLADYNEVPGGIELILCLYGRGSGSPAGDPCKPKAADVTFPLATGGVLLADAGAFSDTSSNENAAARVTVP